MIFLYVLIGLCVAYLIAGFWPHEQSNQDLRDELERWGL